MISKCEICKRVDAGIYLSGVQVCRLCRLSLKYVKKATTRFINDVDMKKFKNSDIYIIQDYIKVYPRLINNGCGSVDKLDKIREEILRRFNYLKEHPNYTFCPL